MEIRPRPTRFVLALALSLGAHLAALLLLAREPARAPDERPIELEIVHLDPVRAPVPAPGAEAAPAPPGADAAPWAAAAPDPRRATGGAGAGARSGRGAAPPADRSDEGSLARAAEAPAQEASASDATARSAAADRSAGAAEGIPDAHAEAEPAPAALRPATDPTARQLDLIPDRYELAGAAPTPGATEPGATERSGAAGRHRTTLDALLADDRAVARATDRVDAYWADLRRELEKRWDVDADLLRDGPRRGLGLAIDEGWKGWQKQAAAYAASGNPYGDGVLAPGAPLRHQQVLPDDDSNVSTLPLSHEVRDDGLYRKERRALILVVQDGAGRVVEVRLHRSSGNAAFDRVAESHARALAELQLGPPPDGSKSLWSFEATLLTTPPLPIAGCAIDAQFVPQHCFYPLSQRVKEAVRLVGVWQADEEPVLH